jgi:subtilisin family serine protease
VRHCLNPGLIFKIELNNAVTEENIERLGLKILGVDIDKAVIVFSNDTHFADFKKILNEYSAEIPEGQKGPSRAFLNSFEGIGKVSPEEKIGDNLSKKSLEDNEVAVLDIELWHPGREFRKQLLEWENDIYEILKSAAGSILDTYKGNSFHIIRARVPSSVLEDILELGQVLRVDRKPKPSIIPNKIKSLSVSNLNIIESNAENSLGILILDSGIISGHPLLKNAIGDAKSFIDGKTEHDESGHGTAVASIALYGDLEKCQDIGFNQEFDIYSGRILDENNTIVDEKLLQHQIMEALEYFLTNYNHIRVINLSYGDTFNIYSAEKKQFTLAAFIDEMAFNYRQNEILFVVSSGNFADGETYCEELKESTAFTYPVYLGKKTDAKIADPGTSALAITVGSLSYGQGPLAEYIEIPLAGSCKYPSPFTRSGPGVNGMIKPDLVEYGGDLVLTKGTGVTVHRDIGVVTAEFNYHMEGLLALNNGTSFSAPKISHAAAKLWKEMPNATSNLIKALLISSANIPKNKERPKPLDRLNLKNGDSNEQKFLLNIYGNGIPSFEKAFSTYNRALLVDENEISLNNIIIYEIPVPLDFYKAGSGRMLTVTLAYDPPTRMTRKQYLGVTLDFRIFKNVSVEDLKRKYADFDESELEEDNLSEMDPTVLNTIPKPSIVNNGTIQKKMWVIDQNPKFTDESLKLVLFCRNKWYDDEEYKQRYAIIASLEQEDGDLYTPIRARIASRVRV